ncbi:unnamed protein product [Symbiodinium sp. KB8]|nr:unnamed protein product [Symbiodinium sp. KB8]
MLQADPAARPSASEVLSHPAWHQDFLPAPRRGKDPDRRRTGRKGGEGVSGLSSRSTASSRARAAGGAGETPPALRAARAARSRGPRHGPRSDNPGKRRKPPRRRAKPEPHSLSEGASGLSLLQAPSPVPTPGSQAEAQGGSVATKPPTPPSAQPPAPQEAATAVPPVLWGGAGSSAGAVARSSPPTLPAYRDGREGGMERPPDVEDVHIPHTLEPSFYGAHSSLGGTSESAFPPRSTADAPPAPAEGPSQHSHTGPAAHAQTPLDGIGQPRQDVGVTGQGRVDWGTPHPPTPTPTPMPARRPPPSPAVPPRRPPVQSHDSWLSGIALSSTPPPSGAGQQQETEAPHPSKVLSSWTHHHARVQEQERRAAAKHAFEALGHRRGTSLAGRLVRTAYDPPPTVAEGSSTHESGSPHSGLQAWLAQGGSSTGGASGFTTLLDGASSVPLTQDSFAGRSQPSRGAGAGGPQILKAPQAVAPASTAENALPRVQLAPLRRPFTYKGSKATIALFPAADKVHAVFHNPPRWFGGMLARQARHIQKLTVAATAAPNDPPTLARLAQARSTHAQLRTLLQSVAAVHMSASSAGEVSLGLQAKADPPPEEHCLPPGAQTYRLARLPRWSRRLYRYMLKVVQVVKSRTPMLVVLSDDSRVALMCNTPTADVAMRLSGGVKLRYALSTQRITVQGGDMGDGMILSLNPKDHSHPSNSTGIAALSVDGHWKPFDSSKLTTALRLWERVLSTRDAIAQRLEEGQAKPTDAALLASLQRLPVVLREPRQGAPAQPYPARNLSVVRARRRRRASGGVKLTFSDDSTLRLSADGSTVWAEAEAGSQPGPTSAYSANTSGGSLDSGKEESGGGTLHAWPVSAAPLHVAERLRAARAFFALRKAKKD